MKLNASNERIKHRYFSYLREARQLGEHSIDQVAKALDRFEEYTRRRSFRNFHIKQAIGFKRDLANQNGRRTGHRLSKATTASTLNSLRDFFAWLGGQRGFRSRILLTDTAYFRPSRSDEAIARARKPPVVPTLDQVRAIIAAMPSETEVDKRNRALVATAIVTGARDNARASLEAQAPRCRGTAIVSGCSRGADEVPQNIPHVVFSRGR